MLTSPLEQFEVYDLAGLSLSLFNIGINISNLGLYILLSGSVMIITFFNGKPTLVPTKFNLFSETIYVSIKGLVSEQIGSSATRYLPFIFTVFTFILFSNLIGNIPYNFSINTSAVISMFMSLSIFIGVTVLGLSIHKLAWFSYFVPGGTPLALVPLLVLIESISYLARAVSLGVRLCANMIAGKILAYIIASGIYSLLSKGLFITVLSLIPLSIFVGLLGLELAVAAVQSYVFTILTCSYISDAIHLH